MEILFLSIAVLYKNGFNGDSAYTFCVGEVAPEIKQLLKTTKESLYLGIEHAVEGKRIGDIGHAVQTYCEARGYSVVREFVRPWRREKTSRGAQRPQLWTTGNRSVAEKWHVYCH